MPRVPTQHSPDSSAGAWHVRILKCQLLLQLYHTATCRQRVVQDHALHLVELRDLPDSLPPGELDHGGLEGLQEGAATCTAVGLLLMPASVAAQSVGAASALLAWLNCSIGAEAVRVMDVF